MKLNNHEPSTFLGEFILPGASGSLMAAFASVHQLLHVLPADILSHNRDHGVAEARKVVIWLLREHSDLTYGEIADLLGYKGIGTVRIHWGEMVGRARASKDWAQFLAKADELMAINE